MTTPWFDVAVAILHPTYQRPTMKQVAERYLDLHTFGPQIDATESDPTKGNDHERDNRDDNDQ